MSRAWIALKCLDRSELAMNGFSKDAGLNKAVERS
jgi:hypothetical protein